LSFQNALVVGPAWLSAREEKLRRFRDFGPDSSSLWKLPLFLPRASGRRSFFAVNVGGCVIPAGLAFYELV